MVRPFVDCRASEFCKPDRLGLRHPSCRCGSLRAINAIIMGIAPPRANVLVAIDPRFTSKPITDRSTNTRNTIFAAPIIPVEALTRFYAGCQTIEIIRAFEAIRIPPIKIVIPPIGKRHIIVDANCIQRRM